MIDRYLDLPKTRLQWYFFLSGFSSLVITALAVVLLVTYYLSFLHGYQITILTDRFGEFYLEIALFIFLAILGVSLTIYSRTLYRLSLFSGAGR